ncbi:MAG: hypothetical protein EZS28_010650 [Streblomastix strix]|uniref:Uncharacterized protein n=1 Tax=Streblomastix strix TaxID=222440 RepID=A0A5J4WFL4_9EUKA|nr:MAG: hypothetical protein EZS28_010650 [Streblomastix strix]
MSVEDLLPWFDRRKNFPEFRDGGCAELVQRLALELTNMLYLNQNGAYFALAYSVTPCGALSISMTGLLLGPDISICQEKKQMPQLFYYIKPAEDSILRKIDINDRILRFSSNDKTDESINDDHDKKEEEEEEEQRQKQNQSGELQPYRDMDYNVRQDESAIRMKTRNIANDLINNQETN